MKAVSECRPCLARLVRQVAELATDDPDLRAEAIEQGLRLLNEDFSTDRPSIVVATPLQRLIRAITGNPDPYLSIKKTEVSLSQEVIRALNVDHRDGLGSLLSLAVLGNSIDFFRDLQTVREDMARPVVFAIDHTGQFEHRLDRARNILYLADNAGEIFFDLPLANRLAGFANVTYVVKESPVQNDITITDMKNMGMIDRFPRVITTGTDTPGVDMPQASDQFKAEFEAADLILAKGMGYWETLSEMPGRGKILHLLKAKCKPVADSLGVEKDSYVALMR